MNCLISYNHFHKTNLQFYEIKKRYHSWSIVGQFRSLTFLSLEAQMNSKYIVVILKGAICLSLTAINKAFQARKKLKAINT